LKKLFGIEWMNQAAMKKVLLALTPILVFSIGTFGWRVLLLTLVSCASALFTEWLFIHKTKKKFSQAVLVSALIYTLTLPPRTPFVIASIGIIFGIAFGREVFGGFGRNVFNPAATARAFVYVSFSKYLTAQWTLPSSTFLGGFGKYITEPIDVLAHSTPMLIYRESGVMASYMDLFIGNISGSIGETSAILVIFAGLYLMINKTSHKETVYSVFGGYFIMSAYFFFSGFPQVPNPVWGLLSGGLLFGAMFMATDPVTSPKTYEGRIIYGIIIGVVTVIIRAFALFAGGIMFAILIANVFVPITDEAVKYLKNRGDSNG
jgi:Na+-transporting NADH:ubiquinone oxidoreductase subunit B